MTREKVKYETDACRRAKLRSHNKWRARLLLSACLTAGLLAGCAVGRDYQRPAVDIPQSWRVEYPAAAEAANTAWWEQFQDPVLTGLVKTALNENKDLRIAAARVEEFAGRLQSVRSGFFPQLDYQASAVRKSRSQKAVTSLPIGGDRRNTIDQISASVSWELDVWGRIRRATEAARADMLAAEESRQAVILTLVSDVADAYVALLSLDNLLATANETLASRREYLNLFERKSAGGQVSALELAQVRSAYEQVAESIPEIERRIALQENALSVLLGRNPGRIERGRTLDTLAMPEIPQGIPSDLLLRRPDIRQSEQNLIAANAIIGVARAQYFPSISLTGLFGYASTALSHLFENAAGLWSVGAEAAGPVFTGGRISGQVRSAEAQQQQLLHAYLGTIQTAFKEVNDSLVSIQKIRELLTVQDRHVAALKEYALFAHNRYNAKYASYVEVLDAERSLFNTQLDNIQTRNRLFAALVNTYKTMGGGWVTVAAKSIEAPVQKAGNPAQ